MPPAIQPGGGREGHDASEQVLPLPASEMWPTTHRELERLQRKLAKRVDENEPWRWTGDRHPTIAGVFVALPDQRLNDDIRDIAWAAAVVMEGHTVIATATTTRKLVRPYRSGYLSLTIGQILEDVVAALSAKPDIILVNAAGRDHVRGAGLAIQLGAAIEHPDRRRHGSSGCRRGAGTRYASWRLDPRPDREPARGVPRPNGGEGESGDGARGVADQRRDRAGCRARHHRPPEGARTAPARSGASRRLRSEHERGGVGLRDGIHA